MPKIQISIPEPCAQNWTSMSPTEKGRYCSSCEKEVIDFKRWTADELQNWFANKRGSVCGRISQKQLNDFRPEEVQRLSWGFSAKVLLASCLALFVASKAYANSNTAAKIAVYEDKNPVRSKAKKVEQTTDSLITISGIVKAEDDKLPLPGVSIAINGKHKTMTDAEGRFKVQIDARKGEEILLTTKYIGFVTQEQKIVIGGKDQIEINMSVSEELVGVMVSYKPSLVERIWNFIKSPFVKGH